MITMTARDKDWFSCFLFAVSLLLMVLSCGCGNKFFDPSQVGRFDTIPSVNVILDSLGVAEETPVAWEQGEEPRPIDTVAIKADYTFVSGDVVRVAIFELLQEGTQFINDYVVTETGKISIPEVGVIEVTNLTETQLEERLKQILSPGILRNPLVTVTLISSQQRTFSILGEGVAAPSRYVIPRYDFRLTDALAMANGPRQFNVSYVYVSRLEGDTQQTQQTNRGQKDEPQIYNIGSVTARQVQRIRQTDAPRSQNQLKWPQSKVVISSSEMMTDVESARLPSAFELFSDRVENQTAGQGVLASPSRLAASNTLDEPISVQDVLKTISERTNRMQVSSVGQGGSVTIEQTIPASTVDSEGLEWIYEDGQWIRVEAGTTEPQQPEQETGHYEWIFQNGQWMPIQVGPPEQPVQPVIPVQPTEPLVQPPVEPTLPDLQLAEAGVRTRLIKIPTDKLLAGDSRYNIIIKPGDTIFVPVDVVGEFYIMGNVNRTGTIPMTGRPMTLKQAIAAAGGLGPLAWPKRCEVIRRIGRKREETVMVDLDKIFSGEQPDFFIKPNDMINVGTHAASRWLAILRNSFRATYGFGFVYDRNFADRDFYTRRPIPDWW